MNKLEDKEIQKNYETMNKNDNEKIHKRKIIIAIVAIIFICVLGLFSTIFAIINIGNEKIINGVYVGEINLSNLTKEEATEQIQNKINEKISQDLKLKYGEYETSINPSLIETTYDVETIVNEALKVGKNGNIIQNNYSILSTIIKKNKLNINVVINEESITKLLEDIEGNLPGVAKKSDYYIDENQLVITKGVEGILIDKNIVISKIYDNLKDISTNNNYIEIAVYTQKPETIDIEKIHTEICKEPQNAYYTKEPFTLYPEVDGIDFDIEKAKELLNEEKDEYVIELNIKKADITTNDLGEEIFPDILGTFTTKYDVSNKNRTTNLRLATSKINGVVLLPGEEFSYNKVVGERTIAAGYKEAKIYSNGQVIDGLGGGICQISSTLYNAVVFANLDVTVRRNHQFVTSYVREGRDATVVYGSQDFQFKNTRKYPIKIEANVNNGIVRISIRGIKEETEYDISFETKTISTIPYNTTYKDNPSLDEGTEQVIQKGTNGIVTETYKITKLNGAVVSRTFLSKDTYRAMERIVEKGTKKSTDNSQQTSSSEDDIVITTQDIVAPLEPSNEVTEETPLPNSQDIPTDEINNNVVEEGNSNTTVNNNITM